MQQTKIYKHKVEKLPSLSREGYPFNKLRHFVGCM